MKHFGHYPLLTTLLLMAFSCEKTVAPAQTVVEQKALLVGNALPVDGCDAHLVIDLNTTNDNGTTALPTEATRALFDKVIAAEEAKQTNGFWMGQKMVTITYVRTANYRYVVVRLGQEKTPCPS